MSHNTLMKAKVKWKGVTFRKEYWLFNETLTDCFLLTWWCWGYTFFREDWGTESCGGGKQEYWDVCSSNFMCVGTTRGFPGGSDSKESACNAGDPGSIPGSERPPGEGNGLPLQYSHLENSVDRGAWQATVLEVQRVKHDWAAKHTQHTGTSNTLSCLFSLTFIYIIF